MRIPAMIAVNTRQQPGNAVPVHPQVRSMALMLKKAGIGQNEMETVEDSRKRLRAVVKLMGRPSADLAEVRETRIEGPEGSIPVRIYEPRASKSGRAPLVLFFHGGGWILGGLDTSEETLLMLCDLSGAVVVSVDYRLAPEHKFPSGLEDCYISAVWAANNAGALGCDARKLIVCGESAGGNLATATCLLAKRRKGPKIAYQILVYPNVDMVRDMSEHSHSEFGPTPAELEWIIGLYLRNRRESRKPLVSPILGDLRGLPPALIFTAENDPLREQDEDYAKRLREAGVRARTVNYPGAVHGFWNFPNHFDSGDDAVRKAARTIKNL
ncbi:MAG: alpha/beta hydrolase [Thaumarchaeota archaeon]|nr:alpha/beta hydrolase [Nitrososphaerota archaeon]